MASRTRNKAFTVALNVLFLNDANPDHEVVALADLPKLDVENNMRIQDLCVPVERLVARKFRFRVDTERLKFFKPSNLLLSDAKEWATAHINTDLTSDACKLQPAMMLCDALDLSTVGRRNVDLIVCGEARDDSGADEEADTVGHMPDEFRAYKRYKALLGNVKKLTPSKVAKSKERIPLQRSISTVIYDGSFALGADGTPAIETIAQPIEIFYPPFGEVAKRLEDADFKPDKDALNLVAELMSGAGQISTEQDHGARLRAQLTQLLGTYIGQVQTSTNCSADGLAFSIIDGVLVPLVMVELKRALGEGGCDPLVQAEYSVLQRWHESQLKSLREKCPCPTFVIAGGGPNLALLGVVWADRFIVQRLTDIVSVAQSSTSSDKQIYKLARVFTVIRTAVQELREYYTTINGKHIPSLKPDTPHPRFFPYTTKFRCRERNEIIEFEYKRPIDDDDSRNLTFYVETVEQPTRRMIVKFSDRYGDEAHQHLAVDGRAPKLFYCGLLDGDTDVLTSPAARGIFRTDVGGLYEGPLHMVVMEYLDGQNAQEMSRDKWPEGTYKDVLAAIVRLHDGGFVFGDLRPPNVMFVRDGTVRLIDFDWSGKEGEVFYPSGLSQHVDWAEGVKSFHGIKKKHDLDMLNKYFK